MAVMQYICEVLAVKKIHTDLFSYINHSKNTFTFTSASLSTDCGSILFNSQVKYLN